MRIFQKPFNTDELRALVASKIQIFNEFYQISITDELTRLYTRREFIKQFNTEIENSQNQVSSLCIIDLDHFKKSTIRSVIRWVISC